MKDKLVSFETAKLAKEKGFDAICNTSYTDSKTLLFWYPNECYYGYKKLSDSEDYIPSNIEILAPSQSLLQRWLREQHNIIAESSYNNKYNYFEDKVFAIHNHPAPTYYQTDVHNTYETGLEKALIIALNLI